MKKLKSSCRLGNYIRFYRELRGLSQGELADLVGVSKNAISSYENSEYSPTALNALLICCALRQPFDKVFHLQCNSGGVAE